MQESLTFYLTISGIILSSVLGNEVAIAQIIPDTTLNNENSTVTPNINIKGDIADLIEGGVIRNTNLFHSFLEFNIGDGQRVFFANPDSVVNIFSRITGSNPSEILGTLGVNGNANLFLINPNGIIFGENASLDINGSFLATTAKSIVFDDGTQFNATDTQTTSLLTISIPVGLNMGATPGNIVNRSFATDSSGEFDVGLQVQPGNTLAFVGGEVFLEGGIITAESGRIEIGSVAGDNVIGLDVTEQGLILSYESVASFQDINLSDFAFIDTSGERGGEIQIQGQNIVVVGGSQVASSTFGEESGGTTIIEASESIELIGTSLDGFPSGLGNQVDIGEGGDLSIKTKRLIIRDGAIIDNSTFDTGNSGNIDIQATESVEIIGTNLEGTFPSGIFAQVASENFASDDAGNAGNININTEQLIIKDGAQIANTARFGGNGGKLTINASEFILLSGTAPDATPLKGSSGIFVSADPVETDSGNLISPTGDAGKLNITTGTLTVENGAKISADNFGSGEGGNATLTVGNLIIRDGGLVRAGSFGEGSGGLLTVNSTESVTVEGEGFIGSTPVKSSLFTRAEGSGDAGDLNINTPLLTIKDGGEITAQASGTGEGGNITFTAEELTLNNGFITASTASTQGGNITLNLEDNLQFINSGEITATAGKARAGGDGGNVKINSDFILAFPTDNIYQITAEAFEGDGGNIEIATNSIFGREFINISASSQFGLDGNIAIDTPDVDPVQGLINLPTDVIDPSQLISQSCLADDRETEGQSSEFIVTGRGGLPPSPNESLKGDAIISPEWVAIDSLATENTENSRLKTKKESPTPKLPEIIQARGWIRGANGRLTLVAENSYTVSSSSSVNYPQCH